MLSYTIPEQEQHRRVRVRLEGSTWSAPFSLDQVNTCCVPAIAACKISVRFACVCVFILRVML